MTRKHLSFRPRLEALEDRCMPSTLTVLNNLDNYSPGSLRADIAAAHSGDTIVFDPSLAGQQILLTGSELIINKNLTIQGLPNKPAISGGNLSRVFDVYAGANVTLIDLAIINGNGKASNGFNPGSFDGEGGGVVNSGTLTVSNCTISGNSASIYGGGIYNLRTLTVSNCTISGNSAYGGGGISNDTGGTLTVSGSSLSGNSASLYGGGILNYGTAAVQSSTLSGNSAGSKGGGIYNAKGKLTISGSVVLNNVAPLGADLFGMAQISKDSTVGVIAH